MSGDHARSTQSRGEIAFAAGVVSALLLALRAPVDVGPRDAGELSTAAWTLGVGHPSGAPFGMVLQQAFSRLPLGTIAFRQGLLMALSTGVAVACGVWVALAGIARLPVQRARVPIAISSAACVVAGAFGPTLLRAGTMTEVYATSLALVAAAWALVDDDRPRATFALGVLAALGASAHVSARVLVPVVAAVQLARVRSWRAVATCAAGFASALPLVLYVPAAASRRPVLSWGDPRTAASFFRHFMASDVRSTFAARTSGGHLAADARAFFDTTLLDLGVPLLSLGAIAIVLHLARRPLRLDARLAVLITVVLDVAYSVAINPMGIVDRQVGHVALLGLSVLAASVVAELRAPTRETRPAFGGSAIALPLGALTLLGVAPRLREELRGDEGRLVAELWTVPGALARVEPFAVVICNGDDLCGGALYAQWVEGARPDVWVVPRSFSDRPGYLSPRLEGATAAMESALAGARPLLVDAGASPYPFPVVLDRAVPLVRGGPKAAPFVDAHARLAQLDSSLCGATLACTPLTRQLLAQAHIGPIGPTLAAGHAADAVAIATLGVTLDPLDAALWNDRAVARATAGDLTGAAADAARAAELDPSRTAAWSNLVAYRARLGDVAGAREAQRKLDASCRGCLAARILGTALDARDGAPAALEALENEANAKGKHDAWCRAFDVATRPRPPSCR